MSGKRQLNLKALVNTPLLDHILTQQTGHFLTSLKYGESTDLVRILIRKSTAIYANLRPLYGCTGLYGWRTYSIRTQYVLLVFHDFTMVLNVHAKKKDDKHTCQSHTAKE